MNQDKHNHVNTKINNFNAFKFIKSPSYYESLQWSNVQKSYNIFRNDEMKELTKLSHRNRTPMQKCKTPSTCISMNSRYTPLSIYNRTDESKKSVNVKNLIT